MKSVLVSSLLFVSIVALSGASPAATRGNYAGESVVGHLYTQTNNSDGNSVLVFDRMSDGSIVAAGSISTGANGTGASLGSQGALAESSDGAWLLAVNAGSNSVSLFHKRNGAFSLTDVEASGGDMPVSVTESGGLVYVLNAGATQNISGFSIGGDARLHSISGSIRPLSSNESVGAAEVAWSPDGSALVVTEKTTNMIDTFAVDGEGRAQPGVFSVSVGTTPYGFGFTPNGAAIVSDAASAAVTSYDIGRKGAVANGGAVGDGQAAPCWLIVSADGRYAWAANAGSATISSYRIRGNGDIGLVTVGGDNANTGAGSHPADLALSPNGELLYTLTTGAGTITSLRVAADGTLENDSAVLATSSHGAGLVAE